MSLADTNFVLALLLPEREPQHAAAIRELATAQLRGQTIEVGEIIVGEVCWTLQSSYGWARTHVAEVLLELLSGPELRAWNELECRTALRLMQRTPSLALADCILLARAAVSGEHVLTFDRRLQRVLSGY